jgi:hypothetical protein
MTIIKIRTLSVLSIFLFLAMAMGSACSQHKPVGTDSAAPASTEAGYQIKVLYKGQPAEPLTLARLQSLPQVALASGDKSESGPTLLAALELDGIKTFNSVIVTGMVRGRIAAAELTLQRQEVTSDVLLDFSNRGTCKLAGTSIPQDRWVIDVSEIRVE